jgi:hypothetical protein
MMPRRVRNIIAALLVLCLPVGTIAAGAMRYVYNAPESTLDQRYVYKWEILRTALERTSDQFGPYEMIPSEPMTEQRQAFEMRNATGKLTVMYLGTTPAFERDLVPVRIPVDKNLGGYCVFLVRKTDLGRYASIQTLDDVRRLTFGLGLGWIDVDILRHNGLKVVTGSNYDGLFDMLANGRFDVFLRAAVEVLAEFDDRKSRTPNLAIEPGIILYYPLPMYFWFPKTDQGRHLAARARDGMMAMIEDGTYDRIFMKYQHVKIERLDLKHRRIFRIENPFLGPETPFDDKRLWFDPGAAPPRAATKETHDVRR